MGREPVFENEIARARALLGSAKSARIFYHRDADGLCGAAIVRHLLQSQRIEHKTSDVLPDDLRKVSPCKGLNIFVDVGSGQLGDLEPRFEGRDSLVLDHHPSQGNGWERLVELNAQAAGLDGSNQVSGSGIAFTLSKALTGDLSMSKLAVVGAVADRQDLLGEMVGLNKAILRDAVGTGLVKEQKDVLLYGRESRPLHMALRSFQDPPIPGVSGSEAGSMELLAGLGIPLKSNGGFRSLGDLTKGERKKLASELVVRCISRASPEVAGQVPNLIIGSVYRMTGEHAPLQYASEFASCVNSAARTGLGSTAIEMLLGDRTSAHKKVMANQREYRGTLSRELRKISMDGVELGQGGHLQYFISDSTPRNVIGPVTGLLLGVWFMDGERRHRRDAPRFSCWKA
jgi:RecJ-like exonuclease